MPNALINYILSLFSSLFCAMYNLQINKWLKLKYEVIYAQK